MSYEELIEKKEKLKKELFQIEFRLETLKRFNEDELNKIKERKEKIKKELALTMFDIKKYEDGKAVGGR